MSDVTRRTMLAGAAWSMPVVMVAVAAPAAAASGGPQPSGTLTATSEPGQGGLIVYRTTTMFRNASGVPVDVPYALSYYNADTDVWKELDTGIMQSTVTYFTYQRLTFFRSVGVVDGVTVTLDAAVVPLG
ncbi:hypothetical protein [Leucobacter sp. wl10]|uniref:hypothetical protein n=1 Tax=Leucobacter sp. wl10 TaxID=2304677 RepID=UPI000E5A6912|nr:hypothetical protein [Leucobacter sp. wl10]RGE17360.1 hypothetical protein D1J51_16000 [Leucobacter sp. wl10]